MKDALIDAVYRVTAAGLTALGLPTRAEIQVECGPIVDGHTRPDLPPRPQRQDRIDPRSPKTATDTATGIAVDIMKPVYVTYGRRRVTRRLVRE